MLQLGDNSPSGPFVDANAEPDFGVGACHLISERRVNPRERWPEEPAKIELLLGDCSGGGACAKLKAEMEGRSRVGT